MNISCFTNTSFEKKFKNNSKRIGVEEIKRKKRKSKL
jgi:hypothetical protein